MTTWSGIIGGGFTPKAFVSYVSEIYMTTNPPWVAEFVVVHNTSSPTLAQWPSTPGERRMVMDRR